MIVAEANEWLEKIRAMSGDDEMARNEEDLFREAVLIQVASGAVNSQQLAAIALKTGDIEFARWCA